MTWTSREIPRRPNVAASVSTDGNGCLPLVPVRGRREVFTKADVQGAWNVRDAVLLVPPRLVLEIVAAVDDDPGLAEVRGEGLG